MTKQERKKLNQILIDLERGDFASIRELRKLLGVEAITPAAATVPFDVPKVHVRWMINRDLPEIFAIERDSYPVERAWVEENFLEVLRQRNAVGMVAERGERVVCFMVYELHKSKIKILRLVVHPDWRRGGIGSLMMEKFKSKLSPHRRTRLATMPSEEDAEAITFLKRHGFLATKVVRDAFDGRDGYQMVFDMGNAKETDVDYDVAEIQ